MDRASKEGRRTRIWLALSLVVCLGGCLALMALQHFEREARGRSAIARLYATNVDQAIRILRPLGPELARTNRPLLRRTVDRTADLLRDEGAEFQRIAPEQAAAVDRALGELEAFAASDARTPAELVAAISAAARIASTAEEVAARQRANADRATQIRMLGSWGALALSALLVGLLIHRDRRRMVALERARADEVATSAEHDALTGLPSRLRFARDAADREASGDPVEVVICDLDDFKEINHRLGHEAGDAVLITVASDLQSAVGSDATLYRTGGDQFALLADPQAGVPARVRDALSRDRPKALGSVGSARWPADHAILRDAIRLADQRMYAAKRAMSPVNRSGLTSVDADAA